MVVPTIARRRRVVLWVKRELMKDEKKKKKKRVMFASTRERAALQPKRVGRCLRRWRSSSFRARLFVRSARLSDFFQQTRVGLVHVWVFSFVNTETAQMDATSSFFYRALPCVQPQSFISINVLASACCSSCGRSHSLFRGHSCVYCTHTNHRGDMPCDGALLRGSSNRSDESVDLK